MEQEGLISLALIGSTLRIATPLLFAGLGGLFSERVGVVQIALEGFMLVGALVAASMAFWTGSAWAGFLSAGVAVSIFALMFSLFTVHLKANQIVVGTAFNILALGLCPVLTKLFFNSTGSTPSLPVTARFFTAPLLLALMTVFKTEATKIATQLELSTMNIEQAAREWAYAKTTMIVKDFRAKTLEILQKARLKQDRLDQAALLALILNPMRAVSLASTQVTTAASAGELSQLKANKAQPKPIVVDPVTGAITQGPTTTTETYWRTRNDSAVCSICGPLNNKPEDVWGQVYPDGPGSAHPNCRCYLETEIK